MRIHVMMMKNYEQWDWNLQVTVMIDTCDDDEITSHDESYKYLLKITGNCDECYM